MGAFVANVSARPGDEVVCGVTDLSQGLKQYGILLASQHAGMGFFLCLNYYKCRLWFEVHSSTI
jgi:hypothetical protein